jgi:hypothetical protein
MSVTFPDGNTWDFSQLSYRNGTVVAFDTPAGAYVVKANPIQVGTTTYVPDLSSQTVALPATGRTIVRIRYSAQ